MDWTVIVGISAVLVSVIGLWISVIRGNRKDRSQSCKDCSDKNEKNHDQLHERIDVVVHDFAKEAYVDKQIQQLTDRFGQRLDDTVQPLRDDVNRVLDILTSGK